MPIKRTTLNIITYISLSAACQQIDGYPTETPADRESQEEVFYLRQPLHGSSDAPTNIVPAITFNTSYFFGDNDESAVTLQQIIDSIYIKHNNAYISFNTDYEPETIYQTLLLIPSRGLSLGYYEIGVTNPITNQSYKWFFYVGSFPYIRSVSALLDDNGLVQQLGVGFSEKIRDIQPGDICVEDQCNTNTCTNCAEFDLSISPFQITADAKRLKISKRLRSLSDTPLKKPESELFDKRELVQEDDLFYTIDISKLTNQCQHNLIYCWGI